MSKALEQQIAENNKIYQAKLDRWKASSERYEKMYNEEKTLSDQRLRWWLKSKDSRLKLMKKVDDLRQEKDELQEQLDAKPSNTYLQEQSDRIESLKDYASKLEKKLASKANSEKQISRLEEELAAKSGLEDQISKLKKQLLASSNKSCAASTSTKENVSPNIPSDEPASIRKSTIIDNSIIIDFAKNVVPTNSSLSLGIHKSSDNSIIETIDIDANTSDTLVSFETRIEDYPHNTIALSLNDFSDKLASQYGVKADSQTGDYWASKLRDDWLLIIDDQSYVAKSKPDWPTDADWSFHQLTPEYTPGEDLSGTKQILLSPKVGINSLKIKPNKALSCRTNYYLKIEQGDFRIKDSSKALDASKLNFDLDCSGESNSSDNTFTLKKPSKFNKDSAYLIRDFDNLTDVLGIDIGSFGINDNFTFAAGKSNKSVKKLANEEFDFLYDEKKGGLYFNENGADKGFGGGGIIAVLKGAPDLTEANLELGWS